MTVSLVQWRVVLGIFDCCSSVMLKSYRCNMTSNFIFALENLFPFHHYQKSAYILLITFLYKLVLLKCRSDTELNPGLNSLSICHWNLNSLPAHNLSKPTQLKA